MQCNNFSTVGFYKVRNLQLECAVYLNYGYLISDTFILVYGHCITLKDITKISGIYIPAFIYMYIPMLLV